MDVDLGQVRAFLATVEHRHFGRAAAQLFITQQSLSKRIQRLERALGQPLLVRDGRAVELTDAGRRFLPHARRLLSTANAATAAVREPAPPLRVDVWGPRQAPAGVRLIPLDPTPLYPWSLAWRADCRHPLLELMLRLIARTADDEGWLAYDAERDWLPDVDHPGYLVNA